MPTNPEGFNEKAPYLGNTNTNIPTDPGTISWGGLVGTILIFLVILALALWIIRRMNKASFRGMSAPWARVLDRQVLNGQQSLYLVEIAGKLQILAGTDHHIVKIDEINDPDMAAEILDEINNRPAERVEGLFGGIAKYTFGGKRRKGKDPFSNELERLLEEVER